MSQIIISFQSVPILNRARVSVTAGGYDTVTAKVLAGTDAPRGERAKAARLYSHLPLRWISRKHLFPPTCIILIRGKTRGRYLLLLEVKHLLLRR